MVKNVLQKNPKHNENWKKIICYFSITTRKCKFKEEIFISTVPWWLGIKTYLNARHLTVWGAPCYKRCDLQPNFLFFFWLLHFYPLKVHEDKSGNIWEVSHLEIIQGLAILHTLSRGESPALPFITKGICLITESLFLKRYLLLLFIPPEVTILCHRTIISTATNCDVTTEGRRNV